MGKTDVTVVELRDYTNHPGTRDTLIELFEREFIAPQEAVGMRVLGTFRDLERPDRFVWVRGFEDMASRERGLRAFYEGPIWNEHRDTANATMIDSDNVLLLEPVAPLTRDDARHGMYIATICSFDTCVEAAFAKQFRAAGVFVSAHYPNTYPRLPVREAEHILVWLTSAADAELHDESWTQTLKAFELHVRSIEVRRFAPTTTSRMQ